MKTNNINPFIEILNTKIEQKVTSVQALATLLNCSADSLYRRLRGETDFLMQEAILICNNLNISIDALYKLQTGFIQFNTKQLITTNNTNAIEAVSNYIQKLHADMYTVDKYGIVNIYYAAKDIPLFCFFADPILIEFKLYFWHLLLFSENNNLEKFKKNWLPKSIIDNALALYKMYNQNQSIEIWNLETINSTIHQIEYCQSIQLITNAQAKEIVKVLMQFIKQLEENCIQGKKNNLGKLQLYFNELLLLDNSVIFDLGNSKVFYMPYQTLNFFSTTNTAFVDSTIHWMAKQQAKSTLISQSGHKDRYRLFTHYNKALQACLKKL